MEKTELKAELKGLTFSELVSLYIEAHTGTAPANLYMALPDMETREALIDNLY